MRRIQKNIGIALVQTLLTAAILTTILLSYAKVSQSAVKLAHSSLERSEAIVELESLRSEIELSLLLDSKMAVDQGFYNKANIAFGTGHYEVRLQDLAGLFNIAGWGVDKFDILLQQLGKSREESLSMAMALQDWQDADDVESTMGAEQRSYPNYKIRNAPMQTFDELIFIKGFDAALVNNLKQIATLYPAKHFNPLSAPEEVLAVYLDNERLKNVVSLRNSNTLDESAIYRFTNLLQGDNVFAVFGLGYRVELTFDNGLILLSQEYEATFDAYKKDPIQIWQKRRMTETNEN